MTEHNPLFVYGTLKKGFSNHPVIAKASGFPARTVKKYAMCGTGIPFVHKTPELYHISGELYQLTPQQFTYTDILEGEGHWYRREMISVVTESGAEFLAWIYFMPGEPSGPWYPTGEWPQPGMKVWRESATFRRNS
jgi:gamma-glutamylaminecyclotransferase